MVLSTREEASLILVGLLLLLLISLTTTRSIFLDGLRDVSKAFFTPGLLWPLASYFGYSGLIVFAGRSVGIWHSFLLKDTAILVVFLGLPLLFNTPKIRNGANLLRKVLRETIGVSALLVFYLGLEPLPLAGELISQIFITFCVLMSAVGAMKPETKKVGSCFQILSLLAVLGLFVFSTIQLLNKWHDYAWDNVLASFSLSIWMPLALLPYIYAFAFAVHCDSVLRVLPFFNQRKAPKLLTRLGFLWGLHFSTRYAALFTGRWRSEIAQAQAFKDSLYVMRLFRHEVRRRARTEKSRVATLANNAGLTGTDADGLALDRREFHATKKALEDLFYYQLASLRNNRTYRADALQVFGSLLKNDLPDDPQIQFLLKKDRKSWRAWRRTAGGWYFGIGGTPTDEKWTYFGSQAPKSFPSASEPEWRSESEPASAEWKRDDGPVRPS